MMKTKFIIVLLFGFSLLANARQTCRPVEETPSTVRCEPIEPCLRSYFWNYDTCSCQIGCDFIKECPVGERWDIFQCGCVVACPKVQCSEGYVADGENCECVEIPTVETTPEPTKDTTCVEIPCRNRYIWLPEVCDCVCPPMVCPEGTHRGNDCDCIEGDTTEFPPCEPIEPCKRGYYWFPAPICQCFLACDYIMICPTGQKWDFIECGCVDDPLVTSCPPTECLGNSILNQTTCNCECPLIESECPGPLGYLDYDFCECRRHPCDPPWPCPEGEIIDWSICNCAPDPNYSSTTTKKGSMSEICSKEHGHKGSKEHGHKGSKEHGHKGSKEHGHKDSKRNSKEHGH